MAQAPDPVPLNKSGDTVVVGSKLPAPYLMVVYDFDEFDEPIPNGVRRVKRPIPTGEPVRIKGNTTPFGVAPSSAIVGGYALTHGVDGAFVRKWLEQNKGSPLLKNEILIVHEKHGHVAEKAKEQAAVKTGMEPIKVDARGQISADETRVPRARGLKVERAEI
jgi:hypothetical protein